MSKRVNALTRKYFAYFVRERVQDSGDGRIARRYLFNHLNFES